MKTVGEILNQARSQRKLSLEQVEKLTKIRKKFLEALEENNWGKLPSLTYVRGFIKNYAEFLELDLNYVLSIFRRQSSLAERQKVLPQGLSEPLNEPFLKLTPSKITSLFVSLLVLILFFWLFGQYRFLFLPPKIVIEKPQEFEIIKGDSVSVRGRTDPRAKLTINGQEVKLEDGKFDQEIAVRPGDLTLIFSATNKFGRETKIERTFKVEGF
jgi:cytoskeletal protein RodZ